jgi:hypothetical protein
MESIASLNEVEEATGLILLPNLDSVVRSNIGSVKSAEGWTLPEITSRRKRR